MKDKYVVLHLLADEGRHILSSWRALLLLRRTKEHFFSESRGDKAVRALARDELIAPIHGKTLYKVEAPYARQSVNPYELAGEAYPSAILSHASALELHQLTDQRSRRVHFYEGPATPGAPVRQVSGAAGSSPSDAENAGPLGGEHTDVPSPLLPPGTTPEDWRMQPYPRNVRLKSYDGFSFQPHGIKNGWVFGHEIVASQGVDVRVTDPERTLIDGLRHPERCGGLSEVLSGWARADDLSADTLVTYTERLGQLILHQRVGFVMETLGLSHERLAHWKEHNAPRGGSRVLDPGASYSSEYDSDWNLSINHSTAVLKGGA